MPLWTLYLLFLEHGYAVTTCLAGGIIDANGVFHASTECFLPSTQKWEIMPSLTLTSADEVSAFSLGSVACIAGGFRYYQTMMCTNGTGWVSTPSLLTPRQYASPIYGSGWMGLAGGTNTSFDYTNVPLSISTTSLQGSVSWSKYALGTTLQSRLRPAVLGVNGTICLAGGFRNTTALADSVCASDVDMGKTINWVPGPMLTSMRDGGIPLHMPGFECVGGGTWRNYTSANSWVTWFNQTIDCVPSTGGSSFAYQPYFYVPRPIGYAANFSYNGMSCLAGGLGAATGQNWISTLVEAHCLNGTTRTWIRLPDLVIPRESPAAFTISADLAPLPQPVYNVGSQLTCISGGFINSYRQNDPTTECFNAGTNRWEYNPALSLPGPTSFASALQLGGIACVVGGITLSQVLCTNGTGWVASNQPPIGGSLTPIYGPNWVGLILQGQNEWISSPVPAGLNFNSDLSSLSFAWTPHFNVPTGIAAPAPINLNGTACIAGGLNGSTFLSTSYCLTQDFSQWLPGPSLVTAREAAITLSINGLSCVGGGLGPLSALLTSIDCATNSGFATSPTLLPKGFYYSANATLLGLPCLVGGHISTGATSEVWCYNATAWMQFPSLSQARARVSAYTITMGGETRAPTSSPTQAPSTFSPTTLGPTRSPTRGPTLSPTTSPTRAPTTLTPTRAPSTVGPTAAPSTLGPTVAPTTAPSHAPTPSPTFSALPAWWGVDYATRFVSSQWSTFTITSLSSPPTGAPTPLPTPVWIFSTGYITSGVVISIPPYNFTAGESYTFWTEIGSTKSDLYAFEIVMTPLVVVVSGGDKDVLAGSMVTLNASGSYDPDLSPAQQSSSGLVYQWSIGCVHATIVGSTSSPTIRVQAGAPENTCQVNVTVATSLPPPQDKPQTRSITIRVVSSLICNISISGPSDGYIVVSDTLRLLATVSTPATQSALTIYQWSVTPPITCSFPPSNTAASRALSLAPFCLTAGVSYQFAFTAGNNNNGSAQAFYTATVVAAPSGGSCSISPLTGVAVVTPFVVNCSKWTQQGAVAVSLTYAVASQGALVTTAQTPSVISLTLPESSSTNLSVQIFGYGGARTVYLLPIVKVTAAVTCPLSSITLPTTGTLTSPLSTLQTLTVAFQQILRLSSANAVCSSALQNTSWQVMWEALKEVVLNPTTAQDDSQLAYLATSFSVAIQTAPAFALTGSNGYRSALDIVNVFAQNTHSATTAEVILQTSTPLYTLMKTNCTASNKLAILLAELVRTATSGNLPSDPNLQVSTGGVSVTSGTYFGDSSTSTITGSNGVTVDLPSALLSQGGDVSVVTVTGYNSVLDGACRSTSGGAQVGSNIVDITLSTRNGNVVGVNNVQSSFSFTVPITSTQCGATTCSWWDPIRGAWNATGCTGTKDPSNPNEFLCTCTHLTEFALLVQPVNCRSMGSVFLALLALYATTAAVILAKLIHRFAVHGGKRGALGTLFCQHFLMFILALARAVACLSLGLPALSATWLLPARAAVLVLPYLVTFWIYTLMVFQWASVFHFSMKHRQDAFSKVRGVFFVSNTLVALAIIALLCTFSASLDASVQDAVALAATSTLAAVTFVTAISFIIYATLLRQSMDNPAASSSRKKQAEGKCMVCDVKNKLFFGGWVVCILLCLQASMHIASVVAQSASDRSAYSSKSVVFSSRWEEISECVVMAADLLGLVVLLLMYHRAMTTRANPEKSTRNQDQSSIRHESSLRNRETSQQRRGGGDLSVRNMNVELSAAQPTLN